MVSEAFGIPTTFEQNVSILADGSAMVAAGIAAVGSRGSIETTPLVRRCYPITGSFGARTREHLPESARLGQTGLLDTHDFITRNFPLEEADGAYRLLREGRTLGCALITMHE